MVYYYSLVAYLLETRAPICQNSGGWQSWNKTKLKTKYQQN